MQAKSPTRIEIWRSEVSSSHSTTTTTTTTHSPYHPSSSHSHPSSSSSLHPHNTSSLSFWRRIFRFTSPYSSTSSPTSPNFIGFQDPDLRAKRERTREVCRTSMYSVLGREGYHNGNGEDGGSGEGVERGGRIGKREMTRGSSMDIGSEGDEDSGKAGLRGRKDRLERAARLLDGRVERKGEQ